jgi:hypothetical protein
MGNEQHVSGLSDADTAFFEKHAIGIQVIYLANTYVEDGQRRTHSPMDYHLHILFYKSETTFGAICLDTCDISTLSALDDNATKKVHELGFELAKTFVERINTMLQVGQISEEKLFLVAPDKLWMRFNKIKRSTFLNSLPEFMKYTQSKSVRVNEVTPALSRPRTHGWASITISEDRFVSA